MWRSHRGCSVAQYARILFGARYTTKIDIRKFCTRAHCMRISGQLTRIARVLVKVVERCRVANVYESLLLEPFIRISKVMFDRYPFSNNLINLIKCFSQF